MPQLIENHVKVLMECIGEGWNGDYNANDPDDEPLLRFDVYIKNPTGFYSPYNEWHPLDDCSYCTAFSENTPKRLQKKAVKYIMNEIKDILEENYNDIIQCIENGEYTNGGIKKLCEKLSWIEAGWLS